MSNRTTHHYISLLRGINVSGHKKILMADLRELYVSMGFKDVQTYIQSGNVIFKDESLNPHEIIRRIENKILEVYGYKVTVIIRTPTEMKGVIDNNPFKFTETEFKRLSVTFLSDAVHADKIKDLQKYKAPEDQYHLNGIEFYFYCPGGFGETKLTNNMIERVFGVKATSRNWNSVLTLAERAKE